MRRTDHPLDPAGRKRDTRWGVPVEHFSGRLEHLDLRRLDESPPRVSVWYGPESGGLPARHGEPRAGGRRGLVPETTP